MLSIIILSLQQILSSPFRLIVLKSVGWTILILGAAISAIQLIANHYFADMDGLVAQFGGLLSGAGLILVGILLMPSVTLLVVGLFLDDVAQNIEKINYSDKQQGQSLSIFKSVVITIKFLFFALIVNFLTLLLVLLPGINFAIFYLANAYLIGREYFKMTGLRYHNEDVNKQIYKRNRLPIYILGLMSVFLLSVPVINLFIPVLLTIIMVHYHYRLIGFCS